MRSAASRPAVVELLRAVGRVLGRRGLPWYVFGAQAAMVYGRPRATADVDIAFDLQGAATKDVLADLAAESIVLRFEPSPAFVAAARLLPMVHTPSRLPLDLLITGPGLEAEFLERARPTELGGITVPLVSAEDLVAMKILAARRKDLDDARDVLAMQAGKLDLDRTRDVLAALEAALGDTRLLRRLDRLVATVERSDRAPAERAKRTRPKKA